LRYSVHAIVLLLCALSADALSQTRPPRELPDDLGLKQGTVEYDGPDFTLRLVTASQTVAAFRLNRSGGFDFTPRDRLAQRTANGYHHLGDLILRLRVGNGDWQDFDTAKGRRPVLPLETAGNELFAASLTPTFPSGFPLQVKRTWRLFGVGGGAAPVQV
jgi:hypothetical protein